MSRYKAVCKNTDLENYSVLRLYCLRKRKRWLLTSDNDNLCIYAKKSRLIICIKEIKPWN